MMQRLRQVGSSVLEVKHTNYYNASIIAKTALSTDLRQAQEPRRKHDVAISKTTLEQLQLLKKKLKKERGRKPRTLCLIDVEHKFKYGMPATQDTDNKQTNTLSTLAAYNKSLPLADKLFDVLVFSKGYHPEQHISLTSRYFQPPEQLADGSYKLTLTAEGKSLGVTLNDAINTRLYQLNPTQYQGDAIIVSKKQPNIPPLLEHIVPNLLFSRGINPQKIDPEGGLKAITADSKDREKIISWLENNQFINHHHRVAENISLDDLEMSTWPTERSQAFNEFLEEIHCKGQGQQILNCLTEDFWPNTSLNKQGDATDSLTHQLAELLAVDSDLPLLITTTSTSKNAPETYSAAKATDGSRATGLLQTLRILDSERLYVSDIKTDYDASSTALDITRMKNMRHGSVDGLSELLTNIPPNVEKNASPLETAKVKKRATGAKNNKRLSQQEKLMEASIGFNTKYEALTSKIGTGISYTQNEQRLDAVLKLIVTAKCSPILSSSKKHMEELKLDEKEEQLFLQYKNLAQERVEQETESNKKSSFVSPSRADFLKRKSQIIKSQAHQLHKISDAARALLKQQLSDVIHQIRHEPTARTAVWKNAHILELESYIEKLGRKGI
ncbi:MAG: hypothetical protein PUP46_05140 [Endozoicomonas sp. (ex Botrylloides leachii)]|nr:hypothetical protein [Endozoicomonas sp. (ex Botrylloides leachii)]